MHRSETEEGNAPQTLFDKLWQAHRIEGASVGLNDDAQDAPELLFVDLHVIHESTSPQAFAATQAAGASVRRPELTLATADHTVPSGLPLSTATPGVVSRQVLELERYTRHHGIAYLRRGSGAQGIVHVVGPERGLIQPGMLIACGDSHTSTLGALGTFSFGIGTTIVTQVLQTQTVWKVRPRTLRVEISGPLSEHVTGKDLALTVIRHLGTNGGNGHAIEYTGAAVEALPMEGRLTLCNMSIEAGSQAGMIAPDDITFAYIEGRAHAPRGRAWEDALAYWRTLPTDAGAHYNRVTTIPGAEVVPTVTWGTTPAMSAPITGHVADPENCSDPIAARSALEYMGLRSGQPMAGLEVDVVFIGSCANSRIEDIRAAARIARGRKVHRRVRAIVVPGSEAVARQAEEEGLRQTMEDAGFNWGLSGCSMCVSLNGDQVGAGERCASTSNRNFRDRQGVGARTHLMSPPMAAAAAVTGCLSDVRELI